GVFVGDRVRLGTTERNTAGEQERTAPGDEQEDDEGRDHEDLAVLVGGVVVGPVVVVIVVVVHVLDVELCGVGPGLLVHFVPVQRVVVTMSGRDRVQVLGGAHGVRGEQRFLPGLLWRCRGWRGWSLSVRLSGRGSVGRCAGRRGPGWCAVGRHAGRTGRGVSRTGGTGHTRRPTLLCAPGGRHVRTARGTVRTRGRAAGGDVRSARASHRGTTAGGWGPTGMWGGRSALGRVRSGRPPRRRSTLGRVRSGRPTRRRSALGRVRPGRSTRGRTGVGTGNSLLRPARSVGEG